VIGIDAKESDGILLTFAFGLQRLPGLWPLPGVGFNWFRFWTNRETLNRAMDADTRSCGLFFSAWVFWSQFIVVNQASLLKQVLVTSLDKYDRAVNERAAMSMLLGRDGLLMMRNGDEWHAKRALLSPAFSRNAMKHALQSIIHPRVQILVRRLSTSSAHGEQWRDLQEEFQRTTFDIAGLLVMGVDVGSQHESAASPFYEAWKVSIAWAYWHMVLYFSGMAFLMRLPSPWRTKFDESKAVLDQCVINALQTTDQDKLPEFPSLLSILRQNGASRQEICDEMMSK
jgi:cytochrome P450